MIREFNVSYADFQLGEIINPDEFDVNYADIAIRINQIITVLNQITDGIGGNGADIVHIGDVLPFTSDRLQTFLQELVDQLRHNGQDSGAQFIGSLQIAGVTGDTVHEQIVSLNTMLTALSNRLTTEVDAINGRISDTNTELNRVAEETFTLDNRTTFLEQNKAEASSVYTKQQTDTEISQLEAVINMQFYNVTEADALLNAKTNRSGNHAGTWQGINVSDLAGAIGAEGIAIQSTRPATPKNGLLWFNPSNGGYELYLNGQWRINTKPTQIKKVHKRVVLSSDSNTVSIGIPNLDTELDAFIVMQNSVFIAEGFEYTATDTYITATNGTWTAGTVFDFVAFIGAPVA